ncbi:SAP domain containing protein [Nitzschia inconspicua]|uniref:SAP domain containing protein n=1 Tax=Nitzschia inconspicua TaxID=303405 RepID=A0A9K3M5N4_9STRA|nr:SAP domain containing protein [Nitzschia inconspicua]
MPRNKKFDKRGGGRRLDAESAEEIELRNKRLEEFEAARQASRAEEDEDGEGEEVGSDDKKEAADDSATPSKGTAKPKAAAAAAEAEPVRVTTKEEHNRNLAKLEAVRRRREEAEAKRKIEQEAVLALEMEQKARIAALQEEENDDSEDEGKKKKKKSKDKNIPKLSKIEIKKMKPAQMKDALKERGLDIQGNAKDLMARLVTYEESR